MFITAFLHNNKETVIFIAKSGDYSLIIHVIITVSHSKKEVYETTVGNTRE
jgi:hypothetical protein